MDWILPGQCSWLAWHIFLNCTLVQEVWTRRCTDTIPTPQHVVHGYLEEGASFLILSPERMKKQRREHSHLVLRGPAQDEAAVTKTQSGPLGSASLATILGQRVSLWNSFRSFTFLLEHPRELWWFLGLVLVWPSLMVKCRTQGSAECCRWGHRHYFMAPYALAVANKWSAWTIGWSFILTSPSSPLKPKVYLWMILFDL